MTGADLTARQARVVQLLGWWLRDELMPQVVGGSFARDRDPWQPAPPPGIWTPALMSRAAWGRFQSLQYTEGCNMPGWLARVVFFEPQRVIAVNMVDPSGVAHGFDDLVREFLRARRRRRLELQRLVNVPVRHGCTEDAGLGAIRLFLDRLDKRIR